MAAPAAAALPSILVMGAAMAFVMYRRARQHIGRQELRPARMKARMAFLCVVAVLVTGAASMAALTNLAGALVGAVAGGALAIYALRLTRMEHTPEGVFYTGNVYIGLGVSCLLIGRIAYRLIAMPTMSGQTAPTDPQAALASAFSSPLTLGLLLVMVGYYVVYYTGLLRKARQV